MVGALVPIYHGAYASLRTPQSTLKALKEKRKDDDGDSDDEDEPALPETLTSEDAYWLPVIGSIVLFSMFLIFKYLDKVWVDRVLGFYFGIVGTFAVSRVSFNDEEVRLPLLMLYVCRSSSFWLAVWVHSSGWKLFGMALQERQWTRPRPSQ